MAYWVIQALRLITAYGVASGAVAAGTYAGQAVIGALGPEEDSGVPWSESMNKEYYTPAGVLVPPHPHRRRRRRRALTSSDRADIAFIAGVISKSAAKDFAVQLATRPR